MPKKSHSKINNKNGSKQRMERDLQSPVLTLAKEPFNYGIY